MQTLFERERRQCEPRLSLARNVSEQEACDEVFAEALLLGVLKHETDIRTAVQQHAPDWSFDRMDPIARCTLLVGAYELLYGNDAPPPVVMNEAIEIAKEFGSIESGKFVNGVLNAMAHRT